LFCRIEYEEDGEYVGLFIIVPSGVVLDKLMFLRWVLLCSFFLIGRCAGSLTSYQTEIDASIFQYATGRPELGY